MINSLIIGYGVVGSNLHKDLHLLESDIYDKYLDIDERRDIKYDIAFIAVPTPFTEDEPADYSEVRNAIMDNDAEVYVIKSAILPNTTEKLMKETGKRLVNSPEYYGATPHSYNFDFDFTILGGADADTAYAQQVLQECFDARHRFYHVPFIEAELVKYMENSWLAYKVSFMHQWEQIASNHQVPYERLRELFILDPRVHPSNTFVYDKSKYWESHCYDKDIPAIAITEDAQLLKDLIAFNDNQKRLHKEQ